jgi:hypothetical protein
MKIKWSIDVSAPCAGEILQVYKNGKPTGRSVLVQTDWDYPGVAQSFGWDMRETQQADRVDRPCQHDGTDGTVPCPDCGLTQTDFISAAYDWLRQQDGAKAEDPGYFSGGSQ